MIKISNRCKRVTFKKPFFLKGLIGKQPPGVYSIETLNEKKQRFSFMKPSKNSTWIRVCDNYGKQGNIQFINIDPSDLEKALKIDQLS